MPHHPEAGPLHNATPALVLAHGRALDTVSREIARAFPAAP